MFRQPVQLLRIAGFGVCIITAIWDLSSPPDWQGWDLFRGLAAITHLRALEPVLELCGYVTFAWALWILLQPTDFFVPSRKKFVLIGLQAALGLTLNTSELLYLVSAEIGFLLPNLRGAAWVGALVAADTAMGFADPGARGWTYPLTANHWVSQTIGIFAVDPIYHLLAFSFGVFAAAESRQRRALEGMQEMHAESARLAERLAIARELHDSLGHQLTGLIVNLQLAVNVQDERHDLYVREAYLLSRALLNNVRSAVTNLRDIEGFELPGALAGMAERVVSPKVSIEIEDGLKVEEQLINHALFRCAQEFVTNAIRHAAARKVTIRLTGTPTHYDLRVQDDGRGVANVKAGNGLTGIRERIEELGGTMEIETAPSAGFAVLVRIPRVYRTPL